LSIKELQDHASAEHNKVVQLADIPFELADDDATTYPFNVDTFLMQDSVDPARNLFAPAYVVPVFDLGDGSTQPRFDLNVEEDEECDQLLSGRNKASENNYWVAYIQGAFQGPAAGGDYDPNKPIAVPGRTATYANNPPSSLDQGSLVYVEVIRDFKAVATAAGLCDINLLAKTTVHEVGHQFGLGENTGGIMNLGCVPLADQHFLPTHLAAIRGRSHP
jgi:hypothetical protein